MSETCDVCGRPPRADGSANLGDEWVNPEAPAVRRDCTRFGRALLEPRVYHPYLTTIECERAGRLAALSAMAEAECERVGRLAALARAEEAEADAQLTRLGLRAAVEHTEWLEAEHDKAMARVAVLDAFVREWDGYRALTAPHLALWDGKREAALAVARAAVGEVPGE